MWSPVSTPHCDLGTFGSSEVKAPARHVPVKLLAYVSQARVSPTQAEENEERGAAFTEIPIHNRLIGGNNRGSQLEGSRVPPQPGAPRLHPGQSSWVNMLPFVGTRICPPVASPRPSACGSRRPGEPSSLCGLAPLHPPPLAPGTAAVLVSCSLARGW